MPGKEHRITTQPVALEPETIVWLESLPEPVRPVALSAEFPHVANRICRVWTSLSRFDACMLSLLLDDRGGRQGFPRMVASEIAALSRHHATLAFEDPAGSGGRRP